jgi:4-hydroxy-3-methylbut-2-enyl diphosphate reductase
VVIVVGGAHSNNTHELVKTCAQFCTRVHHIQTADDLRDTWLRPDDTIGITAGTSTPDTVIDAIEQKLQGFATIPTTAINSKEVYELRQMD